MKESTLHDWNVSPQQAVVIQHEMRAKVLLAPLDREITTIAGADISYNKLSDVLHAAIVVGNSRVVCAVGELGWIGRRGRGGAGGNGFGAVDRSLSGAKRCLDGSQ